MNCLLSGAIVRIGGAQKRADGVAGAKYSASLRITDMDLNDRVKTVYRLTVFFRIAKATVVPKMQVSEEEAQVSQCFFF